MPVDSASVASLQRQYSASNLAGSYAVGANIGSITASFARGEEGWLVSNIPYSGANASTQNLQWTLPAGMVISASGTGYSGLNNYLGAASGQALIAVRYYCTSDGSASLSLLNQAGNTLTVNNQAYIGIERKW